MLPKSEINAFLDQVAKQTGANKMNWRNDEDHQEFQIDEEAVGYPIITKFGDKYLRIAQVRYKFWVDEDRFEWDGRVVLDFVDIQGKLLWRFPPNPKIPELYEAVRFSTSGVGNAIRDFLKKGTV
jgi:hypothetical protein